MSLQLNAPAFQPLQQPMPRMVPPLAPQDNSLTTCTVSADTPKQCPTTDSDRFYQWCKLPFTF